MSFNINKVAVIGAGVMGSSIAAHIVGAGIPVCLLDIVPKELTEEDKAKGLTLESKEFRNKFANAGKGKVLDPKARAIYDAEMGKMIEVGNLSDNLDMLTDCDWIIEVIVENLKIKQNLMTNISKYVKPDAIVSSNTSGVSINEIAKDMPVEFRQRFMGTHFFNPPRYMKLFEIIPTTDTLPELIKSMGEFATVRLGKGVVYAKDTPNFIANRIGVQAYAAVMRLTEQYGYSIPKADLLTGEAIGRPRTATFKTGDLVGLDIVGHVANNVISNSTDEKEIKEYATPAYFTNIVNKGYLGDKTRGGFYKKIKTDKAVQKLVWDYKKEQYVELEAESVEVLDEVATIRNVRKKIKALVWGDKEENKFIWEVVKANLLYTANRIPEIAEDFKQIDNGMKWGFNWSIGPFEIWDAIGVKESVDRMKKEGETVPAWVEKRISEGKVNFYDTCDADVPYILLSSPKCSVIKENSGAVLKNIGDGIACLEFRTKGNTVTDDVVTMIHEAVNEVEQGDYKGLVVANQTKNFSAGANLMQVAEYSLKKAWDKLEYMVKEFQYANIAMKYCKKPVVTAAHGMTLGGGAEMAMHGYMQVAHAETYIGLVELGVGLVPGGGGNKEVLYRSMEGLENAPISVLVSSVKKAWENIAMAKVSSSAHDAIKLGYMKASDRIVMNFDYQVKEAKRAAIELYDSGFRPKMKKDIKVTGTTGKGAILAVIDYMKKGNFISKYDALLAEKVARILTGGDVLAGTMVSEDRILELEREAFVSLCGETKTHERIRYMLMTGKALRN